MTPQEEKLQSVNSEIADPEKYKQFVSNPKAYLQGHGLQIDQGLSDMISQKLQGTTSISDAQAQTGGGTHAFALVIGPSAVAPGPGVAIALV